MVVLFAVVGVLSLLASVALFVVAKGAPHEIEALIVGMTGWLLIIGAAVCERLDWLRNAAKRSGDAGSAAAPAEPKTRTRPSGEKTLNELLAETKR